MNSLRSCAVVLLAAVASACGAAQTGSVSQDSLEPAPPIEAIDQPPPEGFFLDLSTDIGGMDILCSSIGNDSGCDKTSTDEIARQQQEYIDAITPAEGSSPRSIARLRILGGELRTEVFLVAWRARSGKLCIETDVEEEAGGGGSGPAGPCVPGELCATICLDRSGDGEEPLWTLSGIVSSRGNELEVVFDNGREARYPLVGPQVPGFSEYRVFILDLGGHLYQRLTLRRDGKVIGEVRVPPEELALEKCFHLFPSNWPPGERAGLGADIIPMDKLDPALRACLKQAREHPGPSE